MPLVTSTYQPPKLFKNGHFSTIYSSAVRRVKGVQQKRERLELPDSDFLDLDWSDSILPSNKAVIILHGLEGNAQRPYVLGPAKHLMQNGFDVCSVNLRTCSGEANRLYRSYHSGATEDLEAVINYLLSDKSYEKLYLLGFSLGGNLVLKYLGERKSIPSTIKAAMAVSVPCDLQSTCDALMSAKNRLYSYRFKKHLLKKLREKQQRFPDKISLEEVISIKTLKDFDDVYTSKAHNFSDAIDYYSQSSSKPYLPKITTPTLLLNALDDSFLTEASYPYEIAKRNANLYLETPTHGGHVSFIDKNGISYAEARALAFFSSYT